VIINIKIIEIKTIFLNEIMDEKNFEIKNLDLIKKFFGKKRKKQVLLELKKLKI
jgi:hypothetical protein